MCAHKMEHLQEHRRQAAFPFFQQLINRLGEPGQAVIGKALRVPGEEVIIHHIYEHGAVKPAGGPEQLPGFTGKRVMVCKVIYLPVYPYTMLYIFLIKIDLFALYEVCDHVADGYRWIVKRANRSIFMRKIYSM